MTKTYDELISLPTFEARLRYLTTNSSVGDPTFDSFRWVNQEFYRSRLWKHTIRDAIILRDNGCDLAMPGYDIPGRLIVHHINPITVDDLRDMTPAVTDPQNLVCVSLHTHNLIHYGDPEQIVPPFVERSPNDMCPWKK